MPVATLVCGAVNVELHLLGVPHFNQKEHGLFWYGYRWSHEPVGVMHNIPKKFFAQMLRAARTQQEAA